MIVTGDSEVQRDITGCRVLLSNTNPTWTGLELNLGLQSQRPAVSHLSHCTAPPAGNIVGALYHKL